MNATITNPVELRGLGPVDVEESDASPADVRHWSVTEILKAVGSAEGLIHWSAQEAAKAAVNSRATWQAMESENGSQEAIDWIAKARYRKPKGQISDSAFGNGIHDLLEQWALTGERPIPTAETFGLDEDVTRAQQCLDQFDRWLNTFQPEYLATEAAVFSPSYGYAGTCDAFLVIDGVRYCCDYKSSRKSANAKGVRTKPYADSVGLQVAAYAGAELLATWRARRFEKSSKRYYLLSEEERAAGVPVPEVDAGLAMHITPEHCDAYPIPNLVEAHQAFLNAQECARWVFQTSRKAMGDMLVPPGAAA